MQITVLRSAEPYLYSKLIYRFTSLCAEEKEVFKFLKEFSEKMVSHNLEKRKIELSKGLIAECDGTKPKILIDRLLDLEERGSMDRQHVLDQVYTFVGAVSETVTEYKLADIL